MAGTPVGSNALIQEVLDSSNYGRWRLRVQTYLLSEDLWDVVEGVTEPPKLEDDQAGYKAWTKRNAKALYAIQNSCGPEMFSYISKTVSAKTAWEALEQEFQGLNMDSNDHCLRYESFLKYVGRGNWDKAKKCLGEVNLRTTTVYRNNGTTALHEAARIGYAHIVKDLERLLTPEDWKTTNTDSGHTALHVAALYGHVHVVKELPVKEMGEVQDKDGDTALHNAVSAGKLDVVKELVPRMRQEDLQIKNHDGHTALHLAVNKGDMRMVKELVRKAKGENNKQDFEPFTSYVRTRRRDKANECLGKLGDDPCGALTAAVKSRDEHGRTALHVAAMMCHLDVIKGLLSTWQKMRERNLAEDFTRYGSVITEELLMERAKYMVEQYESSLDGFLEIQDDDGSTALHWAVNRNKLDIVKELAPMMRQEALELTYLSFLSRRSALHVAVWNEDIDIVKELVPLMRKEGLEIKDENGNTPLNCAIIKGNVDVVKELVDSMRPEEFVVKNYLGHNAFHQAVVKGDMHIVKELIPLMRPEALEETDYQGFTALGEAIRFSKDELAKYIAEKNTSVFGIPSTGPEDDEIPVVQALRLNRWELARYLYKLTPPWVLYGTDGSAFLCYCFDRKQFDLAWDLLQCYPRLAVRVHGKDKTSPMLKLSRMSYAFLSGSQLTSWQRWIYNRIHIGEVVQANVPDISINVTPPEDGHQNKSNLISSGIHILYEMKRTHRKIFEILRLMAEATKEQSLSPNEHDTIKISIFTAIQRGHFEFVTHICEENPELLGKLLKNKGVKGIFHFAIESRQREVYSLIYGIEEKERHEIGISLVNGDYTLLHYAANLSSLPQFDNIQDAGLQMQRELQWFEEVEKVVPSEMYEHRNRLNDMTARELFTKNHKKLLEDAENSIKRTATSCTVVGTLIITMMFAAAFTVPGGNDGNAGFPFFLDHKLFKVYIVSDAISLVSSTSSVITFLGILTSRYAENDFLRSLPTKIMIGLITLFFAIVSMVIAFSCALILMFGGEAWIVMLSILLTSAPVLLFVWLLFPLLIKTFMSTYGPEIFDKKKQKMN